MLRYLLYFLLTIFFGSCASEPSSDSLFKLRKSNKTNIKFKNLLQETEVFNVLKYGYFYNGGGVAIGDVNNDGLPDIYFTGNMVRSHLYLNKGNWEFEEIAEQAGVAAGGLWNTGVTMADVNGDGYLDIYICRSAAANAANRKNLLFINNRDLTFTEHAETFGLADPGYGTQAAFFDYDRDGDLDMYLLNHSIQEYAGFSSITANLKDKYNANHGDKLFRNDQILFSDVSRGAGIKSNVLGFGLGVAISDLNDDGWPDIYVSNDYNEQDYLYINNQDGTFSDQLEDFVNHVSLFSMGSDIADINNDGYYDIMTLDMLPEGNYRQKMVSGPDNYEKYQKLVQSGFYNQSMRNMLQLNQAGKGFMEIGQIAGVSNTDWSWASLFADFDNDGYKDLFVTNGYQRDYTNMDFMNFMVSETLKQQGGTANMATMDAIEQMPSILEPNYIFKNNGDLTFSKQTTAWGLDQVALSNGAAYGDLDGDGDMDLVVNNINQEAFVYENRRERFNTNHYLKVVLQGDSLNTKGVGAKVTLFCKNQIYTQEQMPTRGFQSSVDQVLLFGLGDYEQVDSAQVIWSDGTHQTLKDIPSDQQISIEKYKASPPDTLIMVRPATWFASSSPPVPIIHKENFYVDFKNEQMLLHKLSTQGPRIALTDLNGDGLDDLYQPGAKGSSGQILIQNSSGGFRSIYQTDSTFEDTDALFFDADGDGDHDLYVVSGGNEFQKGDSKLQDRLYINKGNSSFQESNGLPNMLTSGSCISATDYDQDGDLDLFVGGRTVPGAYPELPRSYLLTNDGQGNFSDETATLCPDLNYPGLVTDAVWEDVDGDQVAELMLVGEWMAVRMFKSQAGKFQEMTNSTNLLNSHGWWNRIVPGDIDNDGDTDFVLGNFGWNSQIKASPEEPVTMYINDFDQNGRRDPILCYYVNGVSYPAYSKDDLEQQIPLVKKKFVSYKEYADKTIDEIFEADQIAEAVKLQATNLSTSILENNGDGTFALRPLPLVAQLSPTYGILIEDFNGDGRLDIVLGGNFLGSRVKFGNYDANRGVLLKNTQEGFKEVGTAESGLWLQGEVRDVVILRTSQGRSLLFARNNDVAQHYSIAIDASE